MSRLLAACTGASIGLAVGWLAGQSTRDALDLHRLSRPETRASVTVRRSGGLAGSQAVEGPATCSAAVIADNLRAIEEERVIEGYERCRP